MRLGATCCLCEPPSRHRSNSHSRDSYRIASAGIRTLAAEPSSRTLLGTHLKTKSAYPLTLGVCALSSSLFNRAKPVPIPCRRGHQTEARTLTYCIPGGCEPRPACDGAGSLVGSWRRMMRRFNMGSHRAWYNVVSIVIIVTYSGCSRSTRFGSGVHRPQHYGSAHQPSHVTRRSGAPCCGPPPGLGRPRCD